MELEVGQVLWLKIRYQTNIIAKDSHPMLIEDIDMNDKKIEIIAMDKVEGKLYQLYNEANRYIDKDNPKERVIYKDSYAQLNNTLTIEYFPELIKYRKTREKLSTNKLNNLLNDYKIYHKENFIPDERKVHMTKDEILELNS